MTWPGLVGLVSRPGITGPGGDGAAEGRGPGSAEGGEHDTSRSISTPRRARRSSSSPGGGPDGARVRGVPTRRGAGPVPARGRHVRGRRGGGAARGLRDDPRGRPGLVGPLPAKGPGSVPVAGARPGSSRRARWEPRQARHGRRRTRGHTVVDAGDRSPRRRVRGDPARPGPADQSAPAGPHRPTGRRGRDPAARLLELPLERDVVAVVQPRGAHFPHRRRHRCGRFRPGAHPTRTLRDPSADAARRSCSRPGRPPGASSADAADPLRPSTA